MAEFNVSYRKAVTMYVPPQTPVQEADRSPMRVVPTSSGNPMPYSETPQPYFPVPHAQETLTTYAQVVSRSTAKNGSTSKTEEMKTCNKQAKTKKKKKNPSHVINSDRDCLREGVMSTDNEESASEKSQNNDHRRKRHESSTPFFKLLQRIKNTLNEKNLSMKNRIEKIVQLVIEWVFTWICHNIISMPFFLNPFD